MGYRIRVLGQALTKTADVLKDFNQYLHERGFAILYELTRYIEIFLVCVAHQLVRDEFSCSRQIDVPQVKKREHAPRKRKENRKKQQTHRVD